MPRQRTQPGRDGAQGPLHDAAGMQDPESRERGRVVKIRYVVTIEVDDEAWATEYGVEQSGIQDDVVSYLDNTIDCGGGGTEFMERLTQR